MARSTSSTTRPPKAPGHLSHSSRETLERCAKSYFLSRMTDAPKRPAVWLAGGSAVHEATEKYDRMKAGGTEKAFYLTAVWEAYFEKHLREARAQEPNENVWKRSSAEPIEVWDQMGPGLVQAYIDWRERSPWKIWTTPAGEPGIELDLSGRLPGCPVEIKAYADRVFKDPLFGGLWILDLKSGKKPPKTPSQFETYSALFKAKYGVAADNGVVFMNRCGTVGKIYDLSGATPEAVGAVYGAAWEQVQEHLKTGFPADTSDCFLCDVSASCAAKGGPLAHLYDPDHPGYTPF